MAVSDFRVYDATEGWVSVGDVAADKVTLPVPSADGTVVLDSPEAGTFSIETNGEDRARFTGDGRVQFGSTAPSPNVGVGMQIEMPSSAGEISLFNSPFVNASSTGHTCEYLRPYLPLSGSMGDLRFSYCVLTNNPVDHTIQNVTGYSVDASIAVGESTNIGFASSIGPRAGNWNIYASGAAPNYFRGQVLTYSGLASAPAISAYGDEDTGTWSPAANTWAVSTGGVERLRVRSDGNVGIGVAGAANILIDGKTDQAFLARLESTNDYQTGLYDGRCGYRIANATNGPFYAEMYLDPTAKTYGFGGSSSGGSLPIIGGDAQADIVVVPKNSVTFNSKIFTPAGTVAAPSVSIFGDEDTGTFSPAADTWAVSTGGTERLRVTDTGDLMAAAGYTPATAQSLATKAYVDDNSSTYVLPIATNSILGGIKIGSGLEIDAGGVASAKPQFQVLTQAEYDAIGTPDPDLLYLISG